MSVKLRQELEKRILTRFVEDALKAGKRLAVSLDRGYDLDEMLLGSRDKAKIIAEATAGDECHIFVQPATGPMVSGGRVVSEGWVYFVYGNEPCKLAKVIYIREHCLTWAQTNDTPEVT